MANKEHLRILRLGVVAWNTWYNGSRQEVADLRGADLKCTDLSGINLAGARLQDADLRYSNLVGADLRGVSLHRAKLDRSNLSGAQLAEAEGLTRAQLCNADGNIKTILPQETPQPWIGSLKF